MPANSAHRTENPSANSSRALPLSFLLRTTVARRFIMHLLIQHHRINLGPVRSTGAISIRTGRTDIRGANRTGVAGIIPRYIQKEVGESDHGRRGVIAIAGPRADHRDGDDA